MSGTPASILPCCMSINVALVLSPGKMMVMMLESNILKNAVAINDPQP